MLHLSKDINRCVQNYYFQSPSLCSCQSCSGPSLASGSLRYKKIQDFAVSIMTFDLTVVALSICCCFFSISYKKILPPYQFSFFLDCYLLSKEHQRRLACTLEVIFAAILFHNLPFPHFQNNSTKLNINLKLFHNYTGYMLEVSVAWEQAIFPDK